MRKGDDDASLCPVEEWNYGRNITKAEKNGDKRE